MSNQDYTEQHSMPPWAKPNSIKWGESIEARTVQALRDLGWKDPNEVQNAGDDELGHCKATMLVNFGPEGRCRPNLIKQEDSLLSMIIKVFTNYEDLLK